MEHSINNRLKVFALIFVSILICHNTLAQKYSFFQLSDVHVTAPELIKSKGKAWEKFNTNGPNLYDESLQLFKSSLDSVRAAHPDFLIISGDMTKDGEKVGHKLVAGLLAEIQNEGIKVFVIPGNHDIDNPFARYYDGDSVWYAEPTTSKDFAEIYADFGYNDAVSKDESSLSYIVYPYKDLALLCMDSNDFSEAVWSKSGKPDTTEASCIGGKYTEETLQWMERVVKEAQASGRTVIAMQHQGLFPHFDGEENLFGKNIVNSTDTVITNSMVCERFSNAGIELVFTGHKHMSDINFLEMNNGHKLWEVNTVTLVEQHPGFRRCCIDGNQVSVNSITLKNVMFPTSEGRTTDQYAYDFNWNEGFDAYVTNFSQQFASILSDFTSNIPEEYASILELLNIPKTIDEVRPIVKNYLIHEVLDVYHALAVGNEHKYDYSELIARVNADFNLLLQYICGGDVLIASIFKTIILSELGVTGSDIGTALLASPLKNYLTANGGVIVDDEDCVITLEGNTTGIEAAHTKLLDDVIYNL
ncbi:MAG: metallophosphoesterase, partial [Prevotellaceae bacterium]|nr:metallophosphoesterase [Prevotellaceae bacterium]